MRQAIYITAICCLTTIFIGCDKQMQEIPEDEIPASGYILFGSEVGSRAELTNDMRRNFAVTAFNYNKNVEWSTVVNTIQPNVLHKQLVEWDGTKEIHSYDASDNSVNTGGTRLVPWQVDKQYAFFAHYPTDLTLSGNTSYGTPYITYTLPSAVGSMKDIMTASVLNTDNTLSNTVSLKFKHRLTALGVQIRNMNDDAISLDYLEVQFADLKYNKVTIPLDESLEITRTTSGTPQKNYALISSGSVVTVEKESTVNLPEHLILIPQEGTSGDYLNGNLVFSYIGNDSNESAVTFDVNTDMKAGRKYYLQMTFSSGSITIAIIESAEWTEKNVEIEFE